MSVGTPVQSAFANQKVEAKDQADSGVSFSGRTVVEKIVNEQTGSNTPDADGSYNSQIKDISVVSTDGNKVRYRINFKDGFTIPKDGYVHFFMESAHQFISWCVSRNFVDKIKDLLNIHCTIQLTQLIYIWVKQRLLD